MGWSAQPARGSGSISAEPQVVRLPDAEYTGVALAEFLSDLAKKVQANDATLPNTTASAGPRPPRRRPPRSTPTLS